MRCIAIGGACGGSYGVVIAMPCGGSLIICILEGTTIAGIRGVALRGAGGGCDFAGVAVV